MHVLIVDDEPLAREELSYLVSQHPQVTSVAEADSCLLYTSPSPRDA